MKFNYCIICSICALSIFWQSCVKDANVKLPSAEIEPVVHCYISPQDSIIRLDLYENKPIYGTRMNDYYNFKPITGAKVQISSNSQTAELIYNQSENAYILSAKAFAIRAGGSYNLDINLNNGKKASASCQIPALRNTTLKVEKRLTQDNSKFVYEWDEISSGLYYRAGFFAYMKQSLYNPITGTTKDTSLLLPNAYISSGEFQYNKSKYSAQTALYEYDSMYAVLLTTDRHYYNYHNSLNNYSGGEDPFAEATGIYTNIIGGHGVFAGFQSYEKRIKKN